MKCEKIEASDLPIQRNKIMLLRSKSEYSAIQDIHHLASSWECANNESDKIKTKQEENMNLADAESTKEHSRMSENFNSFRESGES